MRYFCTYFDQHYLLRGLALHHSLMQHCPEFQLWILCMDGDCYDVLTRMDLPQVRLISMTEIEGQFPALLEAKKGRKKVEYYFTCTPALPLYVLNQDPDVDAITYLDADLYFFADPAPLYEEIADHSIAIIEHRFPAELSHLAEHGIYNVGFLFFRRDVNGLACLGRWLEQCLDWCYDRVEGNRYADQKYLDDWPGRFEKLVVLQHKGANLAPWNLAKYTITFRSGHCFVDGQPLIFFHFHGLKRVGNWLYEPNLARYNVNRSGAVSRIYKPYIKAISQIARRDISLGRMLLPGTPRTPDESSPPTGFRSRRRALNEIGDALRWRAEVCRRIYQGRYILVFGGPRIN
jgi:hypothetical protein